MRFAAFNTGPEFHGLDHIAPLAELLDMPLIVTEEKSEMLARRYYPQVKVERISDLEMQLASIAQRFDVLFECKYWPVHLKSIFRNLYRKEMLLVFCPHGQSDKGFKAPLLAPYALQDLVLLYGDLMIQMLKDLEIWPSISSSLVIGNYRLSFYHKYRTFYDEIVKKEVPLNKAKKTLLYAPTWRDADGASSFFTQGAKVISQLPSDWNLILKVHPLLEQRDPAYFYAIASLVDKKPNALLIHEFPLVYPLLARSDVYLGDASSVGYDFLHFQRPLYFFPADFQGKLRSCGKVLNPDQNIYSQLEIDHPFGQNQKELYRFAFSNPISKDAMIESIDLFRN